MSGNSKPPNGRSHLEHRSFISSPCRCSTRDEPAFSCRSSTFWVTTVNPGQRSSAPASARWPSCGWTDCSCAIRYTYQPQTSAGSRWKAVGVASSSGRKRDQRLSLEPRKVAMPLSADMPAPVKTTGRVQASSRAMASSTALAEQQPAEPRKHRQAQAGHQDRLDRPRLLAIPEPGFRIAAEAEQAPQRPADAPQDDMEEELGDDPHDPPGDGQERAGEEINGVVHEGNDIPSGLEQFLARLFRRLPDQVGQQLLVHFIVLVDVEVAHVLVLRLLRRWRVQQRPAE